MPIEWSAFVDMMFVFKEGELMITLEEKKVACLDYDVLNNLRGWNCFRWVDISMIE